MKFFLEAGGGRTSPGLGTRRASLCIMVLLTACSVLFGVAAPAGAAANLTVTPLAWNIVGLDSNTPVTGPYRFPAGARICNTGSTDADNVTADFIWDDGQGVFVGDVGADPYINLRGGSLSSVSLGSIAAGICTDAYFEAEVTRNAGAYDNARRYHITATDSVSGATGTSPMPRELYVEHLISQSRNSINDIRLNGASIPAGGSMTLMVGNTYTIDLVGSTATQGYNQFEAFINFPNTIFQTLAVSTTYSANDSPYVGNPNDKLYADACLWENDPNSPNYRSCVGGDFKAGGNVTTTYTVKILSGGGTSETLNSLLYDFSGSSYHYNADYGVGARIANIVGPSSVTITKAFTPKVITPGATSVMTIELSNPTAETFTGVNFTDTFPALLTTADTITSVSGCGTPSLEAPDGSGSFSAGAGSLSFANGTLGPNSVCTITVNVTAPAGSYPNTTGHLFINSSTDTGNTGSDTLIASSTPAPPSSCGSQATMATWTMPAAGQGSGGPPPPYTTKATDVSSATASNSGVGTFAIDATEGNPVNSWSGTGWPVSGTITPPGAATTPYYDFVVDTSKHGGVTISFQYYMPPGDWAAVGNNFVYVYSRADGGAFNAGTGITATKGSWQTATYTAPTSGTGTTTFRISAAGAKAGGVLYLDNITLSGCARTDPPTIVKAFAPAIIAENATSTLTFNLVNPNAGATLSGISFTDALPAGLAVSDSSSAQCGGTLTTTAATRTIALTGGSLAAAGNCSFNVTVTGTAAGRHDNITGFVSSTETGASTNYAAASILVVAPPELAKSFAPTSIHTSDSSTLSFMLTNPNLVTGLSGIGFTDLLPAGVTATNGTTSPLCGGSLVVSGGNLLTFSGGTLGANSSCTFSLPVTGTTTGTKNNITSVISTIEGGNGDPASATLVVNDPMPLIGLNKQISTDNTNWFKFVGLALPHDVYYRFTVSNDGEETLSTVDVTDPDVNMAGCSPALPTSLVVGASASCVVGPIAISAVPSPDPFVNTATATTSTYTPPTAVTSSARYGTESLSLAKNATETSFAAAGDVLHYSYVVTNTGGYPLTGPVTVADDKSTDETCPAVSTVGDLDGFFDPGESITCSATYTVQAADVTAGSVTNTATATVAGVTSPSASKTVALQNPALTLAKSITSGSPYAAVGNVIDYSYAVSNTGNVPLAGPVSVADDKSTDESCPNVNTVGNFDANLDPGESITCTASYMVTQADLNAGSVTNTASASADGTTSNSDSETATATQSTALTITKTATTANYDAAGDALTYTFTVQNTGNVTLTNITVTDPTATMIGGPIASLAPGASDNSTFTATYTVTQADVDAGSFVNTATATGTPPSGPDVTDTGSATINAVPAPAITLTKTATTANYDAAGDALTYTFTVQNTGNVTLTNITVTDPTATVIGGPIASLAPGASDNSTFTATYTVTQADVDAGSFTNTATATATPPSGPDVTDSGSATVLAASAPALTIVKSSTTTEITSAGQLVPYAFSVTNTGNVVLSGITVTDPKCDVAPSYQSGDNNSDSLLQLTETWLYTCSHTVSQTEVDAGGNLSNTATADSTESGSTTSSKDIPVTQSPAITLTKTATTANYDAAGDALTYTFTVQNTGNVTLTNITVTDPTATVIGGPIASLAPGASDNSTFTATYTVTQADMDAGSFVNTATATATPPSGPDVTDTGSATINAVPAPAITLTKTATTANYDAAGDALTYTFTVQNAGNVTLTNITVTDPVATVVGGPIGSLAPGASDNSTFTATYTVTQADVDAGSFTNTATATATPPFGPDVTDSGSATVLAASAPALTIVKSSTTTEITSAGQLVPYAFSVTNTGNVVLSGITVTDPKCDVAPSYQSGDNNSDSLLQLTETWLYTCSHTVSQAEVDAGGNLSNTATADSTESGSTTSSKDIPVTQSPTITVTKTATTANYDAAGDALTYTFTVQNTGNVTLTNITVTDPIATVIGGPIASLAPGASDNSTFTATYTVTQADVDAGSFTNTATATATPPSGPDVTDSGSATVNAVPAPAITITKTATTANYDTAGDVLTFTFTVQNTGNVTLTNITVTDPTATAIGGPIASLAPGASDNSTFTATYTVTQADVDAGSFTNTATATGTPPSGPDVTDTGSATVNAVPAPAITITKTATTANYDAAGDVLTYTFTVQNTGNVTLTNITVTDPTATLVGGPIASLAPGASDNATFTATYTVTQADVDAGSFVNTATATGTPPSGPDVTDSGSATVNAVPAPAITITKTATTANYDAAGDALTYTFTVQNTGNVTLTNITVTDPTATLVGGPIASLAPGASDNTTFTATYTVTQADVDAGSFTNTATATGTPPSGPDVTDTGSATVNAVPAPAITITKTATTANYDAAGDALTYTFTVQNTGNVTLTNITVTDPTATMIGGPIGSLAPGASDNSTFTATYTVTQADVDAGSFVNTATATGTPPSGPDVTDTGSATVLAASAPALTIVKSSTTTEITSAGQLVPYVFTVTNTGNVVLSGITVTDPKCDVAPSYQSGDNNSDSLLQLTETWLYTCSHTVSQAEVDAGGNLSNTATADSTESGSTTSSKDIPVTQSPALTLTKTATTANYDAAGDVLTYTFTVQNTGNVTLTNITVTDPIATVIGGPIASLAPGASDNSTFTATYTVTQADVDAGSFTNTATATGTPPSGPDVTDTDTATVPAVQSPALTLSKTVTSGSPYATVGDIINYGYLVLNSGNASLAGPVTVADDKTLVTCPNVNTVGDLDGNLDPGESITCTASYTVVQADINAGSVTNTASASADGTTSNSDSETATATQNPAITVTKTAMTVNYDTAGDVLSYTFTVQNTGNVTLSNITLTDPTATVIGGPIASLAPGASDNSTFTATYTVTQADVDAGSFTNTATATGTPPSGPDVTDTDTATVPATQLPALTLVKSITSGSPYGVVGNLINYSYLVTNSGNISLAGPVTVADNKTTVTCPAVTTVGNRDANLDPAESLTCTARYTVTQADINAGSVTNIASAFANGTTSNSDSETATATQSPALTLVKSITSGSPYAEAGDVISYSYLVTNSGNVSLAGPVTVADNKTTVSCQAVTTVGNLNANLDPAESLTCTARYTVTQADINAGSVTNTASARAGDTSSPVDTATAEAKLREFPWILFRAAMTSQQCTDVPEYCYVVSDRDNENSTNSALLKFTSANGNLELVKRLGVYSIESMALSLDGATLYGVSQYTFGVINTNPASGLAFTPITPSGSGMGTGYGVLGWIRFGDIDGLSFDPTTGILYGVQRRSFQFDILLQIDPGKGTYVPNAFGDHVDYIVIGRSSLWQDLDDIAIDEKGIMYGIVNNEGFDDRLVMIDKETGALLSPVTISANGSALNDIEGLTHYIDGILLGTTGVETTAAQGIYKNSLFKITLNPVKAEKLMSLDQDFSGYTPYDFESVACKKCSAR